MPEDLGSVLVVSPGSKYDSGGKLLLKGNKLLFKVNILQRILRGRSFEIERNEIIGWWTEDRRGGEPHVRLVAADSMKVQGWNRDQVNILTLSLETTKGIYQISFVRTPRGKEPEKARKKLIEWLEGV